MTPRPIVPLCALLLAGAPVASTAATVSAPAPTIAVPAPEAPHVTDFRAGRSRPARVATGRFEPTLVAATETTSIERGQGALLRLPHPAATLFVADPEIADFQTRSAALVYVYGKTIGETVLYAVDGAGQVMYASRVRITPNLGALRDALHRHLPNDAISVEAAAGSIVLSGTVLSPGHADSAMAIARAFIDAKQENAIINLMAQAAPSQVNLRVRIAEVDRNVLKQIGINWDAVANAGRFAFGLVTQNPVTFGDVLNRNTLGVRTGDVSSMIDALAQEGFITLLAQPNLTALSGETASFLAGGEFPVPIAVTPGTGAPTITIEFKKFGVSLDFTPTVIAGNRINLKVRPEVSQLSSTGSVQLNGFSIPGLTVRRAETTVELGSGETFVIAGLLQRTSENLMSKVPGLGDVPIIGALLRSSRYKRNETELAIIVTPYLVKPVGDPARVAAPTDGLVDANDVQRVLGGEFFQTHPAGTTTAKAPQP
jgi:pilus assembly protein CpaC